MRMAEYSRAIARARFLWVIETLSGAGGGAQQDVVAKLLDECLQV